MVGLPYTVSNDDIDQFFFGFGMVEDSIKIGKYSNGKNTGEAVVAFVSADDANIAYNDKYKKYIGSRFIELFLITDQEYANFCVEIDDGYGGPQKHFSDRGGRGRGGRGRGGRGSGHY